jgi:sulfide:quinone oxidoreductase
LPRSEKTAPASAPFEVIVAGGGVAALEALLALAEAREGIGREIRPTLLSREAEFELRPMSVAEPFGRAERKALSLPEVCSRLGASFLHDGLSEIWSDRQRLLSDSGEEHFYDALLLATGARRVPALPGALTFRDGRDVSELERALERARDRTARRLAFVVPAPVRWSLPAYELALMSAEHLSGSDGVEVLLITHEEEPLTALGGPASARVAELLAEAGVRTVAGVAAERFEPGLLEIAGGEDLAVDAAIALPRLEVPGIPGLNQGRHGFVATDPWMRAVGVRGVWVAGDATWFPIKQGGIATQQAEVAVGDILAAAGTGGEPDPFRPVLRGALLTGGRPEFFRRGPEADESEIASAPLWWPPGKLVGRRLAPFLAREWSGGREEEPDSPAHLREEPLPDADHADVLELALAGAEAEARAGDPATALRWLEIAETLNVGLPAEYVERRRRWRREVGQAEAG